MSVLRVQCQDVRDLLRVVLGVAPRRERDKDVHLGGDLNERRRNVRTWIGPKISLLASGESLLSPKTPTRLPRRCRTGVKGTPQDNYVSRVSHKSKTLFGLYFGRRHSVYFM